MILIQPKTEPRKLRLCMHGSERGVFLARWAWTPGPPADASKLRRKYAPPRPGARPPRQRGAGRADGRCCVEPLALVSPVRGMTVPVYRFTVNYR